MTTLRKKSTSVLLCFILSLALTLIITSPVSASSDIKILIDGEPLTMDVAPIIVDGRTLVPVRAILEKLGADIHWNPNTRVVTATKDSIQIQLQIDNPIAFVNNQPITLDVPPRIIDSRTLIPLRFVAENLDMLVDWIPSTRTITIDSPIIQHSYLPPNVNPNHFYKTDYYRVPVFKDLYDYEYGEDLIAIHFDEVTKIVLGVEYTVANFDYFANSQIGSFASNWDLQSVNVTTFNSNKAYEATYRIVGKSEAIYSLESMEIYGDLTFKMFLVQDQIGNVYFFLYSATVDKFNEYEPIFKDFIKSVQFFNEKLKDESVYFEKNYELLETSLFTLYKYKYFPHIIRNNTVIVSIDEDASVLIKPIEDEITDIEAYFVGFVNVVIDTFEPSLLIIDSYYLGDYEIYEVYFRYEVANGLQTKSIHTEIMIFKDHQDRYFLISYSASNHLFSEYYEEYLEILNGLEIIYNQGL